MHAVVVETSLRIDFSDKNSIGPLLGHSRDLRPAGGVQTVSAFQSDIEPELLKDHLVFVECNLVSEALHSGSLSHVVYSFTIGEAAGYPIDEKPAHVVYHTVNRRSVSEISIQLRSQDGALLPLNPNTRVDVTLYLRPTLE